jgi:hypothetical protein
MGSPCTAFDLTPYMAFNLTGEKTQSSTASIHLFDKDGHLLWSAP